MIFTFLIVVGIYLTVIPYKVLTKPEADDESDDAKLEQALMMVEILKSEYIKLLRDNMALRKGDLDNISADVEQSTCAANESSTMDMTTISILSEINQASKDGEPPAQLVEGAGPRGEPGAAPAYQTPAPHEVPLSQPPPLYQKPFPLHRNYFRRRIPDYYYYDMFRRQFYNEPPNEPPMVGQLPRRAFVPNFRRPIQPDPDSRRLNYGEDISNVTPIAVAGSSNPTAWSQPYSKPVALAQESTVRVRPAASLPTRAPAAVIRTPRPPPRTSHHNPGRRTSHRDAFKALASTTRPTIRGLRVNHNNGQLNKESSRRLKSTANDPVVVEVASELMKELDQDGLADGKAGAGDEPWPAFPFKTTLKIFLEKSTRYPVPLPENHAFCFTNPHNRLCKTLIK